MAQTTTQTPHGEEPRRRPESPPEEREDGGERGEEERLEREEERIAAVGGDAEDALDHEEPLEGFELHEDDEDILVLGADSLLEETPVPDDAHLEDFERRGRVLPPPKGPPDHRRLSVAPEELAARVLEELTETDPTLSEEERELYETLPTDKELDIRGGEEAEEEAPPEEIPSRSPSTPTGSPGD